jgi:hypothetical protein
VSSFILRPGKFQCKLIDVFLKIPGAKSGMFQLRKSSTKHREINSDGQLKWPMRIIAS